MENLLKEERNMRQKQFEELLSSINKQNERRHKETMGLIEVLKKQNKDTNDTEK